MISRVAEHCFWMSRYLERAENTARILDVNQALLLDFEVPLEHQWRPILVITGCDAGPDEPDAEAVQQRMTWDTANPVSIVSSVAAARENARIVREAISAEMWERLNHDYLWLNGPDARNLYDDHRSEFYSRVRLVNQVLGGIADATMTHGEPWEFVRLGQALERASQTARILDVKYHILMPESNHVGTPVDHAHWVAILTSCSGYQPFFQQRKPGCELGAAVAEFLLLHPQFPRSLRWCLTECRRAVHAVSGRALSECGNDAERQLADLAAFLDGTTIHEVVRAGLHETLVDMVSRIHTIGTAIHRTYFEACVPACGPSTETALGGG